MTIFWRIFTGFWVAAATMLAIVFSAHDPWPGSLRQDRASAAHADILPLSQALAAYEQKGAAAFLEEIRARAGTVGNVVLFAADGRVLASAGVLSLPQWAALADQALEAKAPEIARVGQRIGIATPVSSGSGRSYAVLLTAVRPLHPRFDRPRFWTKLAVAMVPATLICWALTLYITRPLSRLRATARRLADGELAARAPAADKQRRDEIGWLSRDIDAMAGQIEELLAAQRRFMASVSHELGAPLTRIQIAVTLLQRELPSGSPEGLEQIEREADRLSSLVQELLFLASLEKGALPSEAFLPVSLDGLCGEIVRENAAETEERGCRVSLVFEAVNIQAAPHALRRAIENVCRNAIRHTPRGSAVRFSCIAGRLPGFATLEISDSGPGVPEQMLSKIFKPFVRAAQTRSEGDGAGLGLAIAAEAVALHGGAVWAENRSGGGLIVTIRLPYKISS